MGASPRPGGARSKSAIVFFTTVSVVAIVVVAVGGVYGQSRQKAATTVTTPAPVTSASGSVSPALKSALEDTGLTKAAVSGAAAIKISYGNTSVKEDMQLKPTAAASQPTVIVQAPGCVQLQSTSYPTPCIMGRGAALLG